MRVFEIMEEEYWAIQTSKFRLGSVAGRGSGRDGVGSDSRGLGRSIRVILGTIVKVSLKDIKEMCSRTWIKRKSRYVEKYKEKRRGKDM
jgi:hypothetical protein